ncbi:MAG: hypothetical protein QM820_40725 [Minicystis sp.]
MIPYRIRSKVSVAFLTRTFPGSGQDSGILEGQQHPGLDEVVDLHERAVELLELRREVLREHRLEDDVARDVEHEPVRLDLLPVAEAREVAPGHLVHGRGHRGDARAVEARLHDAPLPEPERRIAHGEAVAEDGPHEIAGLAADVFLVRVLEHVPHVVRMREHHHAAGPDGEPHDRPVLGADALQEAGAVDRHPGEAAEERHRRCDGDLRRGADGGGRGNRHDPPPRRRRITAASSSPRPAIIALVNVRICMASCPGSSPIRAPDGTVKTTPSASLDEGVSRAGVDSRINLSFRRRIDICTYMKRIASFSWVLRMGASALSDVRGQDARVGAPAELTVSCSLA